MWIVQLRYNYRLYPTPFSALHWQGRSGPRVVYNDGLRGLAGNPAERALLEQRLA